MDQKRMKVFRERLLLKKQEILEAYNKNKTYGKEADEEGSQDIADKAVSSYTREFLYSLTDAERTVILQIDGALNRIDDGVYGTCDNCGVVMSDKRLTAVPWTPYCVDCQELSEKGLLEG